MNELAGGENRAIQNTQSPLPPPIFFLVLGPSIVLRAHSNFNSFSPHFHSHKQRAKSPTSTTTSTAIAQSTQFPQWVWMWSGWWKSGWRRNISRANPAILPPIAPTIVVVSNYPPSIQPLPTFHHDHRIHPASTAQFPFPNNITNSLLQLRLSGQVPEWTMVVVVSPSSNINYGNWNLA